MNMFRLILVSLFLSGCDAHEPMKLETVCLDGVQYYLYMDLHRGLLSVRFNSDNTVALCTSP